MSLVHVISLLLLDISDFKYTEQVRPNHSRLENESFNDLLLSIPSAFICTVSSCSHIFFATFLTSRSKIAYIKSKVLDITYIVIIGIKVTKETAMEVDELVYLDFNPETEKLIIKIFITFLSTKIQIVNTILYERGGAETPVYTFWAE